MWVYDNHIDYVNMFSMCLNIDTYVKITNFEVMHKNRFERGDNFSYWRWSQQLSLKKLNMFFLVQIFFTHNIQEFIHQDDLDKLVTSEMLITSMYDKYAKSLNLIFLMVLMPSILMFLHFLKCYSQYITRRKMGFFNLSNATIFVQGD
jgi:hypothetical protein